ncbi:hypothetical protein ACW9KT_15400 [Hymenobacter sp. HD11105]
MRHLLFINLGWLVALAGLLAAIPLGKLTRQREQEAHRRQSNI